MPDDKGTSKAEQLVQESGKVAGNVSRTGKKGAQSVADKVKKLFKGKNKYVAALSGTAVFCLCVFLIFAIVLLMITSVLTANEGKKKNATVGSYLRQIGTFYPRLETPVKGETSVNHTGKKVEDYYFNSTNPFEAGGFGMPNCTSYAWSRAYEMLDSTPNLCTGNAQDWYDYNKRYDYYPYGDEPRLGAIAVWSHDDSGHVAVVEKIEGNTVTFSNSAYSGELFFLLEIDSTEHPNYWDNSSWNFLGFIYVFDELVQSYGSGNRMSEVPLYIQYEEPWGSHAYGDHNIGDSGCGPTSIAMVASYLTGNRITPDQVADFLTSDECGGWWGHYVPGPGGGMTHDVWDLVAEHYGFIYVGQANGIDEAYNELKNNRVIINSQGPGIFTGGGHFIVLSGLWSDGSIRVNDPNDSSWKNYKDRHFTKQDISVSSGSNTTYYVFDSYNTGSSETSTYIPDSEDEFCKMFYKYFKQRGYSKAAICGLLGNIYWECGMNSSTYFSYSWDYNGYSYGMCQWHDTGPKGNPDAGRGNGHNMMRDCPNWNKSIMAQFEYLANTLDNDGQGPESRRNYYWCTGCKTALMRAPNTRSGAMQAAADFFDYYERGTGSYVRQVRAAEYWDMLR